MSRDSTVRMGRDGSRGSDRGWDDAGSSDRDDRGRSSRSSQRPDDFEDRTVRLTSSSREQARPSQDRSSPGTREREVPAASASRDDRERRGNTGPNARPDTRKAAATSSRRDDDSLPDVKPRSSKSKGKRDDDSDLDWPSNEWDELSDVDYWTELAADKPFNEAAATQAITPPVKAERDRGKPRSDTNPGSGRTERREASQRRDPSERRESAERRDSTERRDQRDGLLPAARAPRQTVDAAFAPIIGDSVDAAFGSRTESYGATELRRTIAAGGDTPRPRSSRSAPAPSKPAPASPPPPVPVASPGPASTGPGSGSHPVHPADDDPLTSPSFPRIAADDSRSYRRRRSDGSTGSHSIPAASESQPHSRPYPAMPPVSNGRDAHSASYSQPAINGLDYAAAPAMPPVPAADPYRQHSVSSASESYPGLPASSDYAAASTDYAGSTGSYAAPASVSAGFMPPVGGSYPLADTAATAAYSRPAASSAYPATSQLPSSQLPPSQLPPASAPPSYSGSPVYPGDAGSSGYHGGSGYNGDSGSSGYHSNSGSSGYLTDSGSSGYHGNLDGGYSAASYQPVPTEQPAYGGYSQAASSGQHAAPPAAAPPTAEYSYPVSDASYGTQLPPASDYSSYQSPAQADHLNGYQPAVPAQGGFGVDPVQPGYPSAPYQQTGYPAPSYESDASYPADPYAVDPYGHPGYGSARLPGRPRAADPVDQQPIVYERYAGPSPDPTRYEPPALPEYAGHGYRDPAPEPRWQDLSRDDQPWPGLPGTQHSATHRTRAERLRDERSRLERLREQRARDGYWPEGYR